MTQDEIDALLAADVAKLETDLAIVAGAPSTPATPPVATPPAQTVPPTPAQPPPVIAGAWKTWPLDPVTIIYADGRPMPQYVGQAQYAIPLPSKHMRGAYSHTRKRNYWGGGDFGISNGLADDGGPGDCHGSLFSMDPSNPTVIVQEMHRFLSAKQPDEVWMNGCDEGAMAYADDIDRLIISPLNSFGFDDAQATVAAPKYVATNQFSVPGDQKAKFYAGRVVTLYLNHPTCPAKFAFFQCRIVSSAVKIGALGIPDATIVTFKHRPDYAAFGPLTFDRDAREVRLIKDGPYNNAWFDEADVWFRETDKTYWAGLLEWNPATRICTRRNFKVGDWIDAKGTHSPMQPAWMDANIGLANGRYVPAAVTGRGSEFVSLRDNGFGDWYGAYVYEFASNTMNFWMSDPASVAAGKVSGNVIDRATGCLLGGSIYCYAEQESRIYAYDVKTRKLTWHDLKLSGQRLPEISGQSFCIESGNVFELYMVNGDETKLYLVEPVTWQLTPIAGPPGEMLRGNQGYGCGEFGTVLEPGGAFQSTVPTRRQIYKRLP